MRPLVLLFIFVVSIGLCSAVRVNLQGSFSLGKDILSSISRYVKRSGQMGGLYRRSGKDLASVSNKVRDHIKKEVKQSNIGVTLDSFKGPIAEHITDYVTELALTIETVFYEILSLTDSDGLIFKDPLILILQEVDKILTDADKILVLGEDKFHWVIVIKLISDKFQDAAMNFTKERLDGDPKNIDKVKKKLIQRLIIAIIVVENDYLSKLCAMHKICEKDHKCTTALHHVLGDIEKAGNEKAIEFIKNFYESLPADLFSFLNPDTWHEFQVILSDLSYAITGRAKDVLVSVFKAVDARLYFIKEQGNMTKAYDQQLVSVILSDMDTVYHTQRATFPFHTFLGQYGSWLRLGGKFSAQMRTIMNEIREKLSLQPLGLVDKLKKEVKAFFELTIEDE